MCLWALCKLLNKDPIELIPEEQSFDKAPEIIIDRTETATTKTVDSGFDWLFGNLFKNKKDQIIFTIVIIVTVIIVVIAIIIFLYCYCNMTKAAVIMALVLNN
jgi:nucleoside permease NupC